MATLESSFSQIARARPHAHWGGILNFLVILTANMAVVVFGIHTKLAHKHALESAPQDGGDGTLQCDFSWPPQPLPLQFGAASSAVKSNCNRATMHIRLWNEAKGRLEESRVGASAASAAVVSEAVCAQLRVLFAREVDV